MASQVELVTSGPTYVDHKLVVLTQPIDRKIGWVKATETVRKVGEDQYVVLESASFLGLNYRSRELPLSPQHDARPRRKLAEIGSLQDRRYIVTNAA
jgi:hypothetical protein